MTPTNDNEQLPRALRDGIAKFERRGFRLVRVLPNEADGSCGYTAFLSRRTGTGMRLAQIESDASGEITSHE